MQRTADLHGESDEETSRRSRKDQNPHLLDQRTGFFGCTRTSHHAIVVFGGRVVGTFPGDGFLLVVDGGGSGGGCEDDLFYEGEEDGDDDRCFEGFTKDLREELVGGMGRGGEGRDVR